MLHNKWCSSHYVSLCEKKWLKTLVDQKRKDVLFSSMFFIWVSFLLKKHFYLCFDNVIKFCVSHHYNKNTMHMISTYSLYLSYKHVWSDITRRNLVLCNHPICNYMQLIIICIYVNLSFFQLITTFFNLLLLRLWYN